MASVKKRVDSKQWFSAARKRVLGADTVGIVLWLTSIFFAPLFLLVFNAGDDSNTVVVGSAGLAIGVSVIAAVIIAVVVQVLLARRALSRSW